MKKTLVLSIILSLQFVTKAQWQQVGADYLTSAITNNYALIEDAAGDLYAAYQPFTDNLLYVKKYESGSWVQVGGSASLEPIGEAHMAIGTDGLPVVVYRNYNDSIVVRKFNGSSWGTIGSGPFAKGDYPRIEINSANVIHVVFNNKAVFPWGTSVYKFEGGFWGPLHALYVENLQSSFTDLAFDSNDRAVVSFRRESTGKMSVYKSDGNSWQAAGNTQFTPGNIYYGRLSLDNNDIPYVTFSDPNTNNRGSVMYLNGTTWDYLGSPNFTGEWIDYCSTAFDNSNNPYTVYNDGSTKLMKFDGTTWGQISVSPGNGSDHMLIFNQYQNPVLSYTNIYQNYNLIVKQLCTQTSVDQSINICFGESYQIGGQEFDQAGTFQINLISASGCDSIVNLTLTVLPQISNYQESTICAGETFTVGTNQYSQTGLYTTTLQSVNGCDSVVVTDLTVLAPNEVQQSFELCAGESVQVGSAIYTSSGTYTNTLQSIAGCDSIITTLLVVKDPIDVSVDLTGNLLTSNQVGAQYQWIDCSSMGDIIGQIEQTFTSTESGNYAVEITYDGCVATSDCQTVEILGLEALASVFLMAPNPTEGMLKISGDVFDEIIIMDLSGRHLIVQKYNDLHTVEMDLSEIGAGKYIVELKNKDLIIGRANLIKL